MAVLGSEMQSSQSVLQQQHQKVRSDEKKRLEKEEEEEEREMLQYLVFERRIGSAVKQQFHDGVVVVLRSDHQSSFLRMQIQGDDKAIERKKYETEGMNEPIQRLGHGEKPSWGRHCASAVGEEV
jgi:hypothetical protein